MKRKSNGYFITVSTVGETCRAFIPNPLPPKPPIKIGDELQALLDKALLALGRLDSISTIIPDTALFLFMYIRKEAVLSSQIEGTQSSLSDLLLFENDVIPRVPIDDVREVSNYVKALDYALNRIRNDFPLSTRLLKEVHKILLNSGRGSKSNPGEFKKTQNWIGGSRPGDAVFVPVPPDKVIECMSNLEKFIHNEPKRTQVLIKTAVAHVQFETIHPFLDGNGRLGRLLITLLLCAEKVLSEPMLYLSLYFKTNKKRYYDLLQNTRIEGDWERWIEFFLNGIYETAESAYNTAKNLLLLFEKDQKRIQEFGKAAGSAIRVHSVLKKKPITSISELSKIAKLSYPAVSSAVGLLEKLNIISEVTGKKRGKRFAYREYIYTLSEGIDS